MDDWTRNFENALLAHVRRLVPPGSLLAAATIYSLQTPGKRIRPRLVAEASALAGLPARASELLQFAVELVHTFSLVHDDLPSMDNDDYRRGQPTVHKRFNEAQALLTGDLLFSLGMETLLEAAPLLNPTAFASGLRHFQRAIGAHGLIGGQSAEFEKLAGRTDAELIEIQDRKTTALFRAAVLTPFHWMGIDPSDGRYREALDYANAFGFAFQIADDLEDADQDAAAGARNILSILGRDEARRQAIHALESCALGARFSVTSLLLRKLS